MPFIVTIGCQYYLVKSEAQVVKAMTALAGMVALESRYAGNSAIYWPSDSVYRSRVSFEAIRLYQLLRCDPKDCQPEPGPKQLTNG